MKVYPPKCSTGARASDRLQQYLMQSNPMQCNPGDILSPDLRTSEPSHARGHLPSSLACVEAALIDNHVHALPLSSQSPKSATSLHYAPRSPPATTKEKWKKFALDVLTCVPQCEQEQACDGFLEAMRQLLMSHPPANDFSAPVVHDSYLGDRSSLNQQNLSWSHEQAPSLSSAFLDGSRRSQDVMPRLEELLQMLRSPH